MRWLNLCLLAGLTAAVLSLSSCATVSAPAPDGLPSFASDDELTAFLMPEGPDAGLAISFPPPPPPPPPAPPPSAGAAEPGSEDVITLTASRNDAESITNNQVAGVDEGGIVKRAGAYLVILRRGRLFTVSTAEGDLAPVDRIDAFPPSADADGWYDEMVIHGDTIVVVGYSYEFEATEINRFRLGEDGRLAFIDSHHLRSDDYYGDRNYATRLVGSQLVLYTPLEFSQSYGETDPLASLPGLSRWQPDTDRPRFRRIASASDVYIPAPLRAKGAASVELMHTVTRCDLAAVELDCTATVVLGAGGRTFYVDREAVYVWVAPRWSREEGENRFLYRLPLDGGKPSAIQVRGAPVDQFSFYSNSAAGRLDILAVLGSGGDAMWSTHFAAGQPALLRLPLSRFGDGSQAALQSDYQALPGDDATWVDRNRFVGDWLVYAQSPMWRSSKPPGLVAVPLAGGEPVIFALDDPVSRIESLGRDALVVTDGDALTLSTLDLSTPQPAFADRFVMPAASEAEGRSHAFFFRPDSPDGADGLMGLPVLGWDAANGSSADMLFLRREQRQLTPFGRLRSTPGLAARDDDCEVSCVDWYGNARPIFLGDRILALLGYELVEGEAGDKRVEEIGRIDIGSRPPRRD